jgi:glycosyltransferase involved in cell wall biosynthesis
VNILQLCKYYPPVLGGIELVEKTITKAHSDLMDVVVVVAFSVSDDEQVGKFFEKIYLIKQDVFFKSAPINFNFLFQLKTLIQKHEIERIYVHLPNPFMHEVLKFSKSYLKKMNVEVVAVYHSDIVNQKTLGKIYDFYFCLSKNIYDYWICSSQKLWNSSPVLKNIELRKQKIIPFCTEGNLTFRERKKFQGNLLAVGRLVPYKGFEFLINAINKTNYQLHIIGDGPEFKKLKLISGNNIILHRGISDDEKKKLFDQCDLLIVSSINRAEAYGMIIVEAFEAGLPVIASDLDSGVTFLVQHETTGLLFETKNEFELINSIKRLEDNQELYQTISLKTRKFFDEELSYKHFKDKIAKL